MGGTRAPAAPLAVTLGDPAGVGPEIIVKAWSKLRASGPRFVVVGDADSLNAAFPTGAVGCERVADPKDALRLFPNILPVYEPPHPHAITQPTAEAARAASVVTWIEAAVDCALKGDVSGVVTAPISKAVLYKAGFKFPGHTEFLADLTADAPHAGARGPVMMLVAKDLRCSLVTIHSPLRDVADEITTDKVVHTALVTAEALKRDFGIAKPRLALAALNPHAGEGGAMGREEIDVLAPAVRELRAMNVEISDPKPADTMFHDAARKGYDAAICLYHDQALIPIKTLDFWGGVNVTLGLPIVRTSPDHGTGFDIAGKGIANPDSLISAIRRGAEIAARRAAA
ncbi:MAG TPA: 4-hydroxythreonine-4-phosphate dehydrogenase PdxA [Caulobacteraceae bacterium]|nr:4-hydroxythreonine-4-phosphate dehydrogenase PdxA [Caulobacteraceae bacterium]